jgi:hypothetical protein
MATLYGFEGISSSRIRIRPSIRITPPDSTRPSLDESESHTGSADVSVNSRLQAQVTESLDFRADLEAALAEVSPPPTPPRSPSKGLGKLITQIKPILNGSGIDLILIKNVSVQLFDELRAKANAGDCDELFGLEKQRYHPPFRVPYVSKLSHLAGSIDYDGNNLIINHPSIGHEIIQGILDLVDGGYPRRNPHISMENKIMSGGSADVRLRGGGLKQPDFSIYEIREGSTKHDDEEPTIAFEVGLSQRQRKLGEAAARLLLLCRYGTILLVVTVKIVVSGDPEKLDSVTWTHWEVTSWEKVKKPEEKPANELYVIRSVPDKVDERGMPLAYEITRKSGERQVVVRAAVTAKYQVCLDAYLSQG